MKASLKFREDQKPIFRAKIPLNLLGFPFQSGIAAGESKELSLSLRTFFDSGPALKLAYRPNDPSNPFSFVVKTGVGRFGSPDSASMTMSAEFNPLELGNPRFFIHFKPQLGDFSIKKSQSSVFSNSKIGLQSGASDDEDGSVEVVQGPDMFENDYMMPNGGFSMDKAKSSSSSAAALIGNLFSGMEMSARTAFPVRSGAIVRCRWGVKFPPELREALTNRKARVSIQKLPMLVMNKISIEHTAERGSAEDLQYNGGIFLPAETGFPVNRQMKILQTENELLKRVLLENRAPVAGKKPEFLAGDSEAGEMGKGGDRREHREKMASESATASEGAGKE